MIDHAQDDVVNTNALTAAGRARNEQMRHAV
ncbi:hypothetical protein SDC9_210291 [bioreactor metagenome]|uniref:Uncharacterized protein n=1 Tax=bioreactor metagenome TaxID=1076179 RepID=A0A645JH41_9ZZZZ